MKGGLCDSCISPGACCKRVFLSGGRDGEAIDAPMSHERAEHLAMLFGLPFRPSDQRPDGTWNWACYQLQDDGRCGIYDRRPQLCRDYNPGSDPLCVHYVPPTEIIDPDRNHLTTNKGATE